MELWDSSTIAQAFISALRHDLITPGIPVQKCLEELMRSLEDMNELQMRVKECMALERPILFR